MDNAPSPSPAPESLAELHAQNARHLSALFLGLADLGAEMVQIIAQRARDEAYAAASAPTQLPALVAAHDVMMRSLRRTALLVQKLTKPAPDADHAGRSGDAARTRSPRRGGDSLDRDAPEALERLSDAEYMELLDAAEAEDALPHRPLAEIIAMILKDFGVKALNAEDGSPQITPDDIAALYKCATGLVASRLAGIQDGRAAEGGAADAMHLNGATGCRDP